MQQQLVTTLDAVGKETYVFRCPDGSEVLTLRYGGRILGLFPPGSEENFYWTHPALQSVGSARAFYESTDWHNSGGDRAWLAPEVDVFFPDYPSLKKYHQPRGLDPGDYGLIVFPDYVQLSNWSTLTLSRSRQTIELKVNRWITPAPNPLRHERGLELGEIEYAGYTLRSTLDFCDESAASGACVGLWNLVQMPHGGELLVPTYGRTEPKICFGQIGFEDLLVGDHLVRYKMRASGEHKLTIRAVATAGRVGYLHGAADRWSLIIRNFFVNPSGQYVDVPWSDPDDLGYSTQACNVNSALGSFSELEYHVPAIGGGTGRMCSDDTAQVWAFRGTRRQIVAAVQTLLTPNIDE
jgi:hypothetical protein